MEISAGLDDVSQSAQSTLGYSTIALPRSRKHRAKRSAAPPLDLQLGGVCQQRRLNRIEQLRLHSKACICRMRCTCVCNRQARIVLNQRDAQMACHDVCIQAKPVLGQLLLQMVRAASGISLPQQGESSKHSFDDTLALAMASLTVEKRWQAVSDQERLLNQRILYA
jgi:hypothetical protein